MSLTSVVTSSNEFRPTTQSELLRFASENAATARRILCPTGGRTSLQYGNAVDANACQVHLSGLTQIVEYPARDMTITVEAGMRLEKLDEILAQEGQRLPIDVSQRERATLGGAIACNAVGPRRYGHGTWRDYVIGVSAVDSEGHLFKAGGRVVKNVAGYDLCKVLIGSLGTLGMITQVTFKLRPRPVTGGWIWSRFKSISEMDAALQRLSTSEARPVAIEALNSVAAQELTSELRLQVPAKQPWLGVAVEGTERDVAWQMEQLRGELGSCTPEQLEVLPGEQEPLWRALTDYRVNSESPLSFQASVVPSRVTEFFSLAETLGISLQSHAGNGIVIGHLSDTVATVHEAEEIVKRLRAITRQRHGHLTILQCSSIWKERIQVFEESAGGWGLMKELKRRMDPLDLLNRGRIFGKDFPGRQA